MSDYTPKPEDKFTFNLWTVSNVRWDLFGGPVRDVKAWVQHVQLLAEVGA